MFQPLALGASSARQSSWWRSPNKRPWHVPKYKKEFKGHQDRSMQQTGNPWLVSAPRFACAGNNIFVASFLNLSPLPMQMEKPGPPNPKLVQGGSLDEGNDDRKVISQATPWIWSLGKWSLSLLGHRTLCPGVAWKQKRCCTSEEKGSEYDPKELGVKFVFWWRCDDDELRRWREGDLLPAAQGSMHKAQQRMHTDISHLHGVSTVHMIPQKKGKLARKIENNPRSERTARSACAKIVLNCGCPPNLKWREVGLGC